VSQSPNKSIAKARLIQARREASRRAAAALRATAPPSPLEWAYEHRRIDGKPFTLDRHLPLTQIYEDDHPFIVVMKPAQVGVSELAVTRAIHALDIGPRWWETGKLGLNVAYLFPTITALSDFSKERISGIMEESDYLSSLFSDGWDQVAFKQVGHSYLYLRGAWTNSRNTGLKTFPADVLILDEFDEMDTASVAMAEKRLRASAVRRKLYISTPTLPGTGIHEQYLMSDQHEWETPCFACHAWNTLDYFRDVRANGRDWIDWQRWDRQVLRAARWTVHCASCKAEINRCAPGRWVARNPTILDIRGYHVPSLCFPMVQLAELGVNATSPNPSRIEEFYRSDLGVPYEKGGARLTDAQLQANIDTPPVGVIWTGTTMGVDVGSRFHYRVSSQGSDGQRWVRAAGSVMSWDELDTLMRQYHVRMCVVDALPELHGCQQWASRHPGKVYRSFYPAAAAMAGQLFRPDSENMIVQVNRTMAMDKVYADTASNDVPWVRDVLADPEIMSHMQAPVRLTVTSTNGDMVAVWNHTGPDHLYHASVYDTIAYEIWRPKTRDKVPVVPGRGARGW